VRDREREHADVGAFVLAEEAREIRVYIEQMDATAGRLEVGLGSLCYQVVEIIRRWA
jgi:hypothetical protein